MALYSKYSKQLLQPERLAYSIKVQSNDDYCSSSSSRQTYLNKKLILTIKFLLNKIKMYSRPSPIFK